MRRSSLLQASTVLAALSLMAGGAQAQRIQMPVGYRLTWIGARWQAEAKVVDARGQTIAAPLSFRIADPTVATVSSRGEVTARKPGNTKLWAVSGRDSASALIVVDQWPAHFSFSPAAVRFDARDVRQPLRVVASDSAGVPIVGGTLRAGACRSLNDRVVGFNGSEVVSIGNGSTWIRCSDRGIADSIRVEVQQRATTAIITNKAALLRQRAAGDTFSVRVSARDRNSKEVADARPTWASLNPYVVSVDPVSGRARAVGGGDTRVIVQVGDVADSVAIQVLGPSAQPVNNGPVIADSAPKSKASLIAQELFVYEAETTFVTIAAFDSAGTAVPLSEVTFRVLDTTIASRLDTAHVIGRKTGQTQMLVRYAGMVDTAFVNVRQRPTGGTSAAASEEARNNFRLPEIADSSEQHRRALDDIRRIILTDPSQGARRQNLVFVTNAFGSFAEHLVLTEAGAREDRTGPLFGGSGTLLLFQKAELMGTLRKGSFTSVDTVGENLNVIEFEGTAGIFPVRQLGLRAGVLLRGAKSEIATQTAIIPKVTLVSRFAFIGDVFNTYAAFSLLPKAKMSYGTDPITNEPITETGSLFSRGGEVGIEFRLVRATGLNGALTYVAEQISFDDTSRIESFSAIRLRFGFNIGR